MRKQYEIEKNNQIGEMKGYVEQGMGTHTHLSIFIEKYCQAQEDGSVGMENVAALPSTVPTTVQLLAAVPVDVPYTLKTTLETV